ncbi:hypothetical protein LOTGIDRAFT_234262 [Lottia gigantea]|uniref:Thioredoxin domain-containing protein 12 n=1 Tax=Lottia gigantea TaxID=225164 RepID=V3ZZ47_LOTGI|nr:hypothetical protein LOTGIDRAFT_234262 [Lottia gigantea]ESO89682.1 hypothetical protein LOTGIDRAFT_234262 [Lottia gigantea]
MADFSIISLVSLIICITLSTANELARGWNDKIDWVKLEDGLKISQTEQKPLMIVIHKSWCGACKALMPKFAESKEIEELSKQFVMVNSRDDEEPNESQYTPDGGYIPRILFLDSSGKVRKEFINENGNESYKYYYPAVSHIVESMEKVLKAKEKGELTTKHEEEEDKVEL